MLKLLKLNEVSFLVYSLPLKVCTMGMESDAREALAMCGVEQDEVDWALLEFEKKGDNIADFGINRMLTHTTSHAKLQRK